MRMEQGLRFALKVLESCRLCCPGRCCMSELNRAALCSEALLGGSGPRGAESGTL